MRKRTRNQAAVAVTGVVAALGLAACGGGDSGGDGDAVALSFLVDNAETTVTLAEGLAAAFTAENPDVTINVETRPGGSEGDNLVKTRLATGDMSDLFLYNSGSLLQALNPTETLTAVTAEPWTEDLAESFTVAVTADDEIYGAPVGTFMGGAILYNKKVYAELGLDIPLTWDDFMANNAAVKDAGLTAVIQTYKDTWTSQLFILGDFHNVSAAEPDWAEEYTAGSVKYAESDVAIRGFQHLQEVSEAGYVNEDFASAGYPDGLAQLAAGEGVHYPMLTFALPEIATTNPEAIDDIGVFAIPGDDAETNGLTVWAPAGVYIPSGTEGAELDAAKAFLAFLASTAGCDAQTAAVPPSGPYAVTGCELPEDVIPAVDDIQAYIDREGGNSLALEFLSPIKGPALEQITVEVGSGIRSAEDGAALYDEDVKKQALQLGLEGWS